MESPQGGYQSIDEYIAACPEEMRPTLEALRATIHSAAPEAKEIISYGMPAFALHGNLVYFALGKHHIGLYPTSSATAAFKDELVGYKSSKGAIQFPRDQPLPMDFITRIVKFRVAEDISRAAAKAAKRKTQSKA